MAVSISLSWHVEDDDGRIIKRPMVATRLSENLVNLVDIVDL